MTIRYVVMFSSGIGSWAAARRLIDDGVNPADVTLLFADTNVEDSDNYRFLADAAADLLGPVRHTAIDWRSGDRVYHHRSGGRFVWLGNDHRTIWDVFRDARFLGNSRADPCSRALKREPMRAWLEDHHDPDGTVVVLGFGFEEAHRLDRARPHWTPWTLAAPMAREPFMVKDAVLAWARDRGLTPPRLYDDAGGVLPHANCGGLCVKAGQAQFRAAFMDRRLRGVFLEWEEEEESIRRMLGKDVAILRDRTGGTATPLPLRVFRERLEADARLFDPMDVGTCSCLVATGGEEGIA